MRSKLQQHAVILRSFSDERSAVALNPRHQQKEASQWGLFRYLIYRNRRNYRPVGAVCACAPLSEPLFESILISTRRFFFRPSAVSFGATS